MQRAPSFRHAVEVTDLRRLTLRNVSFSIRENERVGIIGRSGEGKSVLLRCVLGLLRADAGTIKVLGQRVSGRPAAMEGLGVAFQSPGLFDARSISGNLAVGTTAVSVERTRNLLAAVGMEHIAVDSAVTQLSGGQQKRLALLRALIRGTSLIVLDEPTSGLDPATTRRTAALLNREWEREPRSMMVVTHDFDFAVAVCDRILVLADGSLKELEPVGTGAISAESLRDALLEEGTPAVAPRVRPQRRGAGPLMLDFIGLGLPLAVAAMALLGAMLVAQSSNVGRFDVSRFIPEALVLAVFREMAPLIVGLLLASRIGARVAAELASMSYASQLDAMRVLGLSLRRHIFLPFLIAASVSVPVTILAGACSAVAAGAAYAGLPSSQLSIGTTRFIDLALSGFDVLLPLSLLVKGVTIAASVVSVAYWCGTSEIRSAQALGRAVTRATVLAAISVVAADIVWSWAFFG